MYKFLQKKHFFELQFITYLFKKKNNDLKRSFKLKFGDRRNHRR